jgi:hypothetical protein
MRRGEIEHAAGVIAVLVSDEDCRDLARKQAEPREPALGVAQAEATIDEDSRRAAGTRGGANFYYRAVPAAAAPERRETQQLAISTARGGA